MESVRGVSRNLLNSTIIPEVVTRRGMSNLLNGENPTYGSWPFQQTITWIRAALARAISRAFKVTAKGVRCAANTNGTGGGISAPSLIDTSSVSSPVSAWVTTETSSLVTPTLSQGNYGSGAVNAVTATATYFKDQWVTTLDTCRTVSATFRLNDGTQVLTDMMRRMGNYACLVGSNFQAVRLPYGQSRLSMLIVLPDAGTSLSLFVADVTAETLNSWIAQLQPWSGSIELPLLMSTFGDSLPPGVTSLDMSTAFSDTFIKVDESTTVTIGNSTAEPPPRTMTMDHPFFYAIRDDVTGELLFIGTLVDPG